MDREELAWAAGLFDGEGWVGTNHNSTWGQNYPRVAVTQADRRVLDRFAAAVGLGKIYGPILRPNSPPHHKPRYDFVATHTEAVQAICGMLWHWLSPVKREQFSVTLLRIRDETRARGGRCINGHDAARQFAWMNRGVLKHRCLDCVKGKTLEKQKRDLAHALLVAI